MQAASSIGTSLDFYLFVSFALFTIGAIGAMTRKNMIVLLMCIELMLNAVNLMLVTFSTYYNNGDAQIFVFFTMVVAAAEATVGLSIIIMAYRNLKSIDIDMYNKLKN
ncbi:MAG: NADH-quinone oxidoreductase subunit NuoK [Crocinitomicaceae bacterium]|jgi:NADH-quinone oxidoreductase subunit K|nr:NADH-quinone oxidoreductase subunit NuoK [Crocinitomicaceae bacterium]TAF89601.1 MAG: NADH-quinone oxidoreductase subunit NuoK [Flavobacteriia bacterium]MDP4596989.1 NADH-quinone oxidoreductase subunit NuoK [Crocinitomicaceae bacterium]MDP4723182.1 NADH-quinone oxidoreductase subunit NuoK [Crocinitomicaceae bacterium]MDP4740050.1 NADH-quinone oxidoreductase subunit NuoK [Crocinitomicaceae bacterium]